MATIVPTKVENPFSGNVVIWKWETITEADVGQAVPVAMFGDKSIQVVGDFGTAGAVDMEGALFPAASADADFDVLADAQGTDLSIVSADKHLEVVLEATYWFRPKASAGSGMDVDVYLFMVR